ncbi:Cysteine-rich receptor protein kinase 25 [Spatholobus suberectus]|nr:Cysteine-rich receptor protein kinase 25 [Spatholobus suberectus]
MVFSKFHKPNNTSMVFHKILFLFILVSVLSFQPTEAQQEPTDIYQNCSSNITTVNSGFQFNLRTLLFSLSSNASDDTQFYNTTITDKNPTDSVYGMFMCRGDVPPQLCQQCVLSATQQLSSKCPLAKEAVTWYVECMVRYSNRSFFSTVDTRPPSLWRVHVNVTNPKSFIHLLLLTVNQTADEAAHHPIAEKKYATREASVSEFQTLYSLAQCTPDLSPHDCRTCLGGAIEDLLLPYEGSIGGVLLYPSCYIWYATFPFYRSPSPPPPPALVPATNTYDADSKFSEDPVYLSHNCSSNDTSTSSNTFQVDLKNLLSYLSSNATSGKDFHMAYVIDRVFGLYMCQGDLPSRLCGQCVLNATSRISSECASSPQAIIWYSHCMLRYSYQDFFYNMDTSTIYSKLNVTSTSSHNQEPNFFTFDLSNTLIDVANAALNGAEKYGIKSIKLNALQTLYTLAQCTQDLSYDDCLRCLQDVIYKAIPWSRLGSVGGRVLYPSCNVRFELFQFYKIDDEALPTRPGSPTGEVL